MSKIKLLIVVFVFGFAGAVYASNPAIQDKSANHNHANHSEASCCSTGAACCDGGSCCAADKEHQACNTDKEGQKAKNGEACCKPGAACCDGSSCCSHKSDSQKADPKPAKKMNAQTAKSDAAKSEASCCSGGSCCTGGSCCAKHKS